MTTGDNNQKVVRAVGPAEAVTGVQLMQGIGHQPAQGFWTEAWARVVRRPGALLGLCWLAIVVFFAVFAPFIASGHPILLWELGPEGSVQRVHSPMFDHLGPTDALLALGAVAWGAALLLPLPAPRSKRLGVLFVCSLQAALIVAACAGVRAAFQSADAPDWMRSMRADSSFRWVCTGVVTFLVSLPVLFIPFLEALVSRLLPVACAALVAGLSVLLTWHDPIPSFTYRAREACGEIRTLHTLIPYSPGQGSTSLDLQPPRSTPMSAIIDGLAQDLARELGVGGFRDDPRWQVRTRPTDPLLAETPLTEGLAPSLGVHLRTNAGLLPRSPAELLAEFESRRDRGEFQSARDVLTWLESLGRAKFWLGTDSIGQDVLSQMLHACRLSISIGLVSTGIAVLIGVTMGALMGYFGGWVDMLLYRVVEVFMAIPVLFLLIVAAAVLPRNTYVMMVIIGCVSWTGAARFIRAEFYKLRGQDFVQSARAVGLPLRSILFKHMLPNGVTPVLVDASFAIAAAILAEAILSFLGLGPANQASWGRLLSDANNQVGDFVPWLALFPGAAIFFTVLAYNLIGEALRDAIDPKLKKARV
ncbi:MAG: ABC transporter permease [Phycisphaeraceae bacterium]|nr:ABC transporter permease [Phycisphaeraceae bacterium]